MTYTVHHEFPATGEWAAVTVATLKEAEQWFRTKTAGRCWEKRVVTLTDSTGASLHYFSG